MRVEAESMSAQGARVIDLEEYRRRRAAKASRPPALVVWVPVWMWVPCWPMQ